jgi:phosphate transport system substrate-binding protein
MLSEIKMKKVACMAAVIAITVFAATSYGAPSALRGKITVDGSSTVYPVTEAAAAGFRKDYPNINVTVGISGTGGGFKRFVKGETDISDASRPIKPTEFMEAMKNGVQFIELPVALDGLSIVVNPANNWAKQLTVEELKAIYLENGKGKKWSDLNPQWPNEPIKVYSPGTDSGTFDYFKEVVVGEGESFRPDMSTSEDDNVLVTGVAGDKYAIGYFGAAYYYENKNKLTAVPIVNPKTGKAVLPDPEHVISGEYAPLSRPLFIYINANSLRRPEMRVFAEYYVANSAKFAVQVGYVAVSEDIHERAEQFLRNKTTGSTYVTLEKREGGIRDVYTEQNVFDTK